MHCKALGVEHVIAKVKNEVTKEVLERIGADLVILPEVEAGMSLAKMILFQHGIEVFQLDEAVVVVEFTVPASWVGKSIRDLEIRDQFQLNIIGYRDAEEPAFAKSDWSRLYLARRGARDGGDRQPVSG